MEFNTVTKASIAGMAVIAIVSIGTAVAAPAEPTPPSNVGTTLEEDLQQTEAP